MEVTTDGPDDTLSAPRVRGGRERPTLAAVTADALPRGQDTGSPDGLGVPFPLIEVRSSPGALTPPPVHAALVAGDAGAPTS